MPLSKPVKTVEKWINEQLASGRYAFALSAIRNAFPNHSDAATKSALKRVADKGLVMSIHKGYYLIIPPQYQSKGVLPPALYLDALMKELDRSYYLALLNAAAYHGAAHQQPQEFFVVTNFPVLRQTNKKGLRVNYISKKVIQEKLLETKKTEAGYLKVSNPVLTATDLIQYSKRVGGLARVVTVLIELIESITSESIDSYLMENVPATILQRFGYLLDCILDKKLLASHLYNTMKINNVELFRVPLVANKIDTGCPTDLKWKIIINTVIEIEE